MILPDFLFCHVETQRVRCDNTVMLIFDFIRENFNLLAFLISAGALVVSVIKEPRRFRNAMLLMLTLLTFCLWMLVAAKDPDTRGAIAMIISAVVFFLVLIVPCLLIYDGFLMIKREGLSLSSLLAALFAVFIFSGEIALLVFLYNDFPAHLTWVSVGLMLTGYSVFYISFVFLAFMFYSTGIRWLPRRVDFDYVVVLGCGLINGDQVSRLLGDRLDKAFKVYDRSMSACKIICSGGKGPDEKISEAEAMKNYLIETHGVSPKDIILEDQSVNTMENLRNSQEIIHKRGGRQFTAVVSSGYHILRANIYASKLNFPETGIGAHTALYYWPSAMIREYAALIRYYWRPYFLTLIVIGVILTVITASYHY